MTASRAAASGLAIVAILIAGAIVMSAPGHTGRDVLRSVYSPTFAPVPEPPPIREAIPAVWRELRAREGNRLLQRWLPSQAGALWIALIVTLVVGIDLDRPRNPRNVDLLAMQVLGLLFFDILIFLDRLQRPHWVAVMWLVFSAIVAVSLFVAVRAVWRVFHPLADAWRPALRVRALACLALVLLALDTAAALVRPPDDAGYFVNLGAQRLRERGLLPYGDPLLTGTPGAGYGPLLYAAHVPFQLLVDPSPVNPVSSPRPPLGTDSTYYLPAPIATQLCTIVFHLLGAAALYRAGRRWAGREIGWTLVALYAGSAFVLGVGGDEYFIGGMTFVSHIAPAAFTTAAFAALARPALAGALLVAATGCGFYPAFLVPAWTGFYWDRTRERRRFLTSIVLCGLVLGAAVLLLSRPADGRGLVGTILWDTFGHHTDPRGYGASPFGFWGQRTGLRQWLLRPLAGGSGLTAPVFLLFVAFAASCFSMARRRSAQALALLSAAVVICFNVLKVHSTGTYVEWFYPFLLLGLFLPSRPAGLTPSARIADSP